MPDNATLSVLIEIQAQLAGLQATVSGMAGLEGGAGAAATALQAVNAQLTGVGGNVGGLEQARTKLQEVTAQGHEFFDSLKAGFALDIAGRISGQILGIGDALKHAAEEGVHFNAQMQTSTIGMAAALRSVEPAKYLNFDQAQNSAGLAFDVIRQRANAAGLDVHAVLEAEGANLKALVEGGIKDTGRQLDVVTTLMGAAASKGVTGMQALKDSIDILNGRAGNIVLAKELGLESEALKEAAHNGELYEYIMGKIGGYQEAILRQAGSYQGVMQTAHNLVQQMEGDAARPIFETLQSGIASLNKDLQGNGSLAGELRDVGRAAGEVVGVGVGVTRWAVENAGALGGVSRALFDVAAGYALLKTAQLGVGVGAAARGFVVSKAAAFDAQAAAVATMRLAEAERAEAAAAQLAAAQEERLALMRQEAAMNARLASIHAAHELPGAAPQLYGPPINLAAPLVAAEAEAAPVMARVAASYSTLFTGIAAGAATLGKAIYAALGPVGIAFIAAEAIYLLVDHATAAAEKREHDLLDLIGRMKQETADFKRQVAVVDTVGARDALVKELDAKVKELVAARDDVAKAVAELDRARSTSYDDFTGEAYQGPASQEQKTLEQTLELREGELRLVQSLHDKAAGLTEAELSRRSVEQAITSEVEAQNKELSDMVAKLPGIIKGLQDASHQAKLANDLANAADSTARLGVLRGEQGRQLSQAANLNAKAGGNVETMMGSADDMTAVLQGMSDRVRAKGSNATPDELRALEEFKDKISQVRGIENQINAEERQRTQENQRQADAAGKMRADLDRENAVNRELLAGHKDRANQIQFEAEVEKKAVEVSKALNINMTDARRIARENLSLDVQAHDAANAAKNAKKESAAAGRESAAAARDEAAETREIANERLRAVQAAGQRIESNPFLFADNKNSLLLGNLQQQASVLQANNQLARQYIANLSGGGAGVAGQLRSWQKSLADGSNQLLLVQQRAKALTMKGGIQSELVSWANQFGSSAQQAGHAITSVLGHAVDGISNAITGLILGTTTLKQAFSQMASSIVADLVKMAVEFVIQRAVMWAANQLFGQADASAATSQASTAAAAWTPAAVAASTASYGVAAGVGLAATLAAMASGAAAGAAMSTVGGGAGFATGGYTGDGLTSEVAGAVHRREVVWNARDVEAHGGWRAVDRLRTMRVGTASADRATAGVGPAADSDRGGRGGGRGVNVHNHHSIAVVRDDNQLKNFLQSARGEALIVSTTRKHRSRIGIKT